MRRKFNDGYKERTEAGMVLKDLNQKQRRQLKKLLHKNNRKTQQELIKEFMIEYGSNPDPQIEDFDLHREELVTANIKSPKIGL